MLEHYEREVFHHIPIMSSYAKYSDKYGFPRREIIQPALPDQILRAAFMLTWQAGGTWRRNATIREATRAIDVIGAVSPAMRIKKPTAHQAEKLQHLLMLVEQINEERGFKSEHQYSALKALLIAQHTGDRAHLSTAGMNLYTWAGEQ